MSYMQMISQGLQNIGNATNSYIVGEGKKDAVNKQLDALKNLQYADVADLNKQAITADTEQFQRSLDLQAKLSPDYANLRTEGAQALLEGLRQDQSGNTTADQALAQAKTEALGDTGTQSLINSLVDRAKDELNQGATLSPEFQQELVRAGLERAGSGRTDANGRGVNGTNIRTLLGSEGEALKQSRENSARANASAASGLQSLRASLLGNLATLDNNLRAGNFNRATTAVNAGQMYQPATGLTGSDVTNLNMGNLNLRNSAALGEGALRAQYDLAKAEQLGGIIQGFMGNSQSAGSAMANSNGSGSGGGFDFASLFSKGGKSAGNLGTGSNNPGGMISNSNASGSGGWSLWSGQAPQLNFGGGGLSF